MKLVADSAQVTVPATVGDLGPTFGSVSLAVDMTDSVKVRAVAGPTSLRQVSRGALVRPAILRLHGEDAGDHPTVSAFRYVLDTVGSPHVGLEIVYEAGIPRGVGLGSREAQVAAGFMIAKQLLGNPKMVGWRVLGTVAEHFGLSMPRVAGSIFGGVNLILPGGGKGGQEALPPLSFEASPRIQPTVFIPEFTLDVADQRALGGSTSLARCAVTGTRAAALIPLLTQAGGISSFSMADWVDSLLVVTGERLYQEHWGALSPASMELAAWLHSHGLPAVLSGAGPAVATLLPAGAEISAAARRAGWETFDLQVYMPNGGPDER